MRFLVYYLMCLHFLIHKMHGPVSLTFPRNYRFMEQKMGLPERLRRFYTKPASEKWKTICFLARQQFASIPFLPVPFRLRLPSTQTLTFWWSYFCSDFDESKGIFDYRGRDEGYLLCLCRILRPGMSFFDIGAYHGLYSIIAGKKLGPDAHIFIFEPWGPTDTNPYSFESQCY